MTTTDGSLTPPSQLNIMENPMETPMESVSPNRERDENLESLKKYPRHRHSTELKLNCIKRFENGEKMGALSHEYGVAKCTVRSWVKNKTNLMAPKAVRPLKPEGEVTIKQEPGVSDSDVSGTVANGANGLLRDGSGDGFPSGKPKPRPRAKPKPKIINRELDIPQLVNNSLLKWYECYQQRGITVTREQFADKADSFFKKHGIENFYMTNEWLAKWCKQHSFKLIPESLESIPMSQITDIEFYRELKNTLGCTDYQKSQVFNCSVISWNYKLLPFTLAAPPDKDDYMRVFSFANADLSLKVPLICTLNSGKKKFWQNEFNLPLYSTESDAERLDSTVFTHWLNHEFLPHAITYVDQKNLPMKILMILDQEIFEEPKVTIDFEGLKVILVSKSSSFLVRPFDTELVSLMKNCKRSFLKKVMSMTQENSSVPLIQHLGSINNGHFLAWIKMHWKRGPEGLLELTDTQLVRGLPGGKSLSVDTIDRWFKRCHPDMKDRKSTVIIKNEIDADPISTQEANTYIEKLISYFDFHKLLQPDEMFVFNNAKQRITDILQLNQVG